MLGALDSLESFEVNKLAFLTKARLSFGIYPHRVLQQHSYRQAPIGARSPFWAGKCSSLAVPSARERLDQKVRGQSSPCPAGFLICASPNWPLGCGRTGGGKGDPWPDPATAFSCFFILEKEKPRHNMRNCPSAHQSWIPATQQVTKRDHVWHCLYSKCSQPWTLGGTGTAQHSTAQPCLADPTWQVQEKQQPRCYFSPSKSCKIHGK